MSEVPLIQIGGTPASISATADAIALILQIGAETRTSESILCQAIQVLGKASDVNGISLTGCTITGEKTVNT